MVRFFGINRQLQEPPDHGSKSMDPTIESISHLVSGLRWDNWGHPMNRTYGVLDVFFHVEEHEGNRADLWHASTSSKVACTLTNFHHLLVIFPINYGGVCLYIYMYIVYIYMYIYICILLL